MSKLFVLMGNRGCKPTWFRSIDLTDLTTLPLHVIVTRISLLSMPMLVPGCGKRARADIKDMEIVVTVAIL